MVSPVKDSRTNDSACVWQNPIAEVLGNWDLVQMILDYLYPEDVGQHKPLNIFLLLAVYLDKGRTPFYQDFSEGQPNSCTTLRQAKSLDQHVYFAKVKKKGSVEETVHDLLINLSREPHKILSGLPSIGYFEQLEQLNSEGNASGMVVSVLFKLRSLTPQPLSVSNRNKSVLKKLIKIVGRTDRNHSQRCQESAICGVCTLGLFITGIALPYVAIKYLLIRHVFSCVGVVGVSAGISALICAIVSLGDCSLLRRARHEIAQIRKSARENLDRALLHTPNDEDICTYLDVQRNQDRRLNSLNNELLKMMPMLSKVCSDYSVEVDREHLWRLYRKVNEISDELPGVFVSPSTVDETLSKEEIEKIRKAQPVLPKHKSLVDKILKGGKEKLTHQDRSRIPSLLRGLHGYEGTSACVITAPSNQTMFRESTARRLLPDLMEPLLGIGSCDLASLRTTP